jgi:hypothetical protein
LSDLYADSGRSADFGEMVYYTLYNNYPNEDADLFITSKMLAAGEYMHH